MLRSYTSRPTTVMACMIEEDGKTEKVKAGIYRYTHKGRGAASTLLEFTVGAKQKAPVAGDFIIRLDKEDIYLCGREVFLKKYEVKGMVIK